MEENINIAEILKDKKNGLRLYSPIFGECAFCYVREDTNDICVKKQNGVIEYFNSEGLYFALGEVMLFPSKEMRDWSKFFKKGDVLVYIDGKCKVIFDKFDDYKYTSFIGKHYLESYGKDGELQDYEEIHFGSTVGYTKEYEEAAQTYINTIEERLGGKINRETLEIENDHPEFKDGDIVFMKGIKCRYYANCIFILRSEYKDGDERAFYYAFYNADDKFTIAEYGYTRVHYSLRPATDSEKQQLFDALAKKGKRWDADKKQIVDLKPKWTLKPFDKVIVRCSKADKWSIDFFSYKVSNGYVCTGDAWFGYCLPYNEETAKLIGTTNNVEG